MGCCTIEDFDGNSGVVYAKLKMYEKEPLLSDAQESESKEALFFEYGDIKFCIILDSSYLSGMTHLGFHAMSRGTESFTETGYKSIFASTGEEVRREDVEEYMRGKLLECGVDIDNPKPQLLGVSSELNQNLTQNTLF